MAQGGLLPSLRHKSWLIPYKMVRSNRAKYLRVEWHKHYAKVTAPKDLSNQKILEFLFKQSSWLASHIKRRERLKGYEAYMWPQTIQNACHIPYMGTQLNISVELSNIQKVYRKAHQLIVLTPNIHQNIEPLILAWLKAQALRFANHWSKRIVNEYGLVPRSIVIKSQKSRWGSCGIHDDLYLNWRLICCPKQVFKYVVIHEHCHLKHRNHSKRYWNLVEEIMLDYKQHDRWLSKYGQLVE